MRTRTGSPATAPPHPPVTPRKHRDEEHDRVETEFWQRIDDLQKRYHGAQQDIADVLGVRRNQIHRQTTVSCLVRLHQEEGRCASSELR
ncbi:hypothetical protein [Streptomyces sp. NPDC017964]|uniref:hypothetical protein n=1 Tax=Streptomyces sp. NPDC017964 TaxID=3365022 RepID=UPI00379BF7F9